MFKIVEFSHKYFGRMEVMLTEDRMLFSDQFLRNCLSVKNNQLPNCSDIGDEESAWVDLFEVFEYVRHAKARDEIRWDFEEWIADIIKDCSKLL